MISLNEVLYLVKVFKKECFVFKLDFDKAYDYSVGRSLSICCRNLGLMVGGELGLKLMYFREASLSW